LYGTSANEASEALNNCKQAVLVVDDDKSVLRTFSKVLERSGYSVDVAETGKEAMEKASKRCFDAVLIDFRLPDMDGTDLLQKAKNDFQNTTKIMITGLPSMDVGTKALDGGADAFLVKPVKPDELLALIAEKLRERTS